MQRGHGLSGRHFVPAAVGGLSVCIRLPARPARQSFRRRRFTGREISAGEPAPQISIRAPPRTEGPVSGLDRLVANRTTGAGLAHAGRTSKLWAGRESSNISVNRSPNRAFIALLQPMGSRANQA